MQLEQLRSQQAQLVKVLGSWRDSYIGPEADRGYAETSGGIKVFLVVVDEHPGAEGDSTCLPQGLEDGQVGFRLPTSPLIAQMSIIEDSPCRSLRVSDQSPTSFERQASLILCGPAQPRKSSAPGAKRKSSIYASLAASGSRIPSSRHSWSASNSPTLERR